MGAFLSPPPPHTPSPEAPRDSPDPLFTSPPTSTRLLADERGALSHGWGRGCSLAGRKGTKEKPQRGQRPGGRILGWQLGTLPPISGTQDLLGP